MDYLGSLASLFVIHILALVSPGPNVFIVTQTAMSRERRSGVLVAFGLATGAAIWSTTALIGLTIVTERLAWLYEALRLIGGCYLVYLGVNLWRHADERIEAHGSASVSSAAIAYRTGLFTTLTNPKAAIFFSGVFAAVLPASIPLWVKIAAVLLVVLDSTAFHVGLALFFSTEGVRRLYERIKKRVDRIAGTVLATLGLRIVVGSRW